MQCDNWVPYVREDGTYMRLGSDMVAAICQPELSQAVAVGTVAGNITIDGKPMEYLPQVGTGMGAIIITYFFIKLINKILD